MARRRSAPVGDRAPLPLRGQERKLPTAGWRQICGRLAAVSWLVVVGTSSSHAEINTRTLTLAGMSDCLTEAIATNSVVDDGSAVVFSCSAAKAKMLFNFLGKKIPAEVVYDRNGKFENRPFGNSACYHRVEDQSGKTADEFRCDLIMAIGNILGD